MAKKFQDLSSTDAIRLIRIISGLLSILANDEAVENGNPSGLTEPVIKARINLAKKTLMQLGEQV